MLLSSKQTTRTRPPKLPNLHRHRHPLGRPSHRCSRRTAPPTAHNAHEVGGTRQRGLGRVLDAAPLPACQQFNHLPALPPYRLVLATLMALAAAAGGADADGSPARAVAGRDSLALALLPPRFTVQSVDDAPPPPTDEKLRAYCRVLLAEAPDACVRSTADGRFARWAGRGGWLCFCAAGLLALPPLACTHKALCLSRLDLPATSSSLCPQCAPAGGTGPRRIILADATATATLLPCSQVCMHDGRGLVMGGGGCCGMAVHIS